MNALILAVICFAVGMSLGIGVAAFHIANTFWDNLK